LPHPSPLPEQEITRSVTVGVIQRAALVFCCLLGACDAGSPIGADGRSDAAKRPAVPVSVAIAERRDVPVDLAAIGNVEPHSAVAVKSRVQGQLAEVHFQEGQQVSKGQLLFTVDPRPFEAAVQQAEANLARDRAEAENAAVEAKRQEQLIKDGFVSRNEYDAVVTKAAALHAAAKADEAALETAKLHLQFCSIRSPIDGRIGEALVNEGNVIKENETTLAIVNQLRPIYVNFSVPEQHLPEIRLRSKEGPLKVEVTPEGQGAVPVTGELSFIDNNVDSRTGTVALKGLFANEDESLWPGQFVNVRLTLRMLKDAVVIPFAAVQTGQEGQYVFVVRADHTVDVRPVGLGEMVASDVVIASGLDAGEQVVVEGQVRLAAGARIEIKDIPKSTVRGADQPPA